MILYWIVVGVIMFVAVGNGRALFDGEQTPMGVSTIVAPAIWLSVWSLALIAWMHYRREGLLRLAGQIVLVTLSLAGAVLGGGATFIGMMAYFNYGVNAERVARDHYTIFAIGGGLALVPALLLAGITVSILLFLRRARKPQAASARE